MYKGAISSASRKAASARKAVLGAFGLSQFDERKFESTEGFLKNFAVNFALLMLVVLPVDAAIRYFTTGPYTNSLYPLQEIEAYLVCLLQNALGMPAYIRDTNSTIIDYYPPPLVNGLAIVAVCTALREIVFLSMLVLLFPSVRFRSKIRWVAILGTIMFVVNLIRIAIIYPMTVSFGREVADIVHLYFWEYGQLLILMALFVLWFAFVARKEMKRTYDANKKSPRLAEQGR